MEHGNVGGIIGFVGGGRVSNCSVKNGTIKSTMQVKSSGMLRNHLGGIVGSISGSNTTVESCCNGATINGAISAKTTVSCDAYVGGIVGYGYTNSTIINCYNYGSMNSSRGNWAGSGGIVGRLAAKCSVIDCYNYGVITVGGGNINMAGGIVGNNGWDTSSVGVINNSYCISNVTYSYFYAGQSTSTKGRVSADTLKTYASQLGSAFTDDTYNINQGYPILTWQKDLYEKNNN